MQKIQHINNVYHVISINNKKRVYNKYFLLYDKVHKENV